MSSSLPAGTITFLFCDIVGSTRLWEKYPTQMQDALARHDRILRESIETNQGTIIKTTGDGFHAAFPTALDGVMAAFCAQQALCSDPWPEIQPDTLRSRLALSTGEAVARTGDYYGTAVNRAARLMAVGHGGQVLLSSTTAELVQDSLPAEASLLDLGEHRLRDLVRPERIYQLLHPSLLANFPPLNSLEVFPNNLPVQLTSFIGREDELTAVKNLLGSSRLVTLIGPGGTGKTRLALQTAADLLMPGETELFPQGVWLVELAPQIDPDLVMMTVAEVFHLREMPNGITLTDLIINYLQAKQLLLILDNCEHLIEACARLADIILHACPGVKILASSREAMGISGEMIHRVPSLTIPQGEPQSAAPGSAHPAAPPRAPVETLLKYEAVQLFVERATAAQPRFALTERNAAAVIHICQRLDGIPLALELAAARVQVFTPEQIASRLDDRFRLLTGGSRTALHRQQTLRALIDWSYDLLTIPEQTLFRLLSVFSDGWCFEAAEAVSSDDVLDILPNLVNKSLVNVNDEGGAARYLFLETIRQYARDKLLEAGEAEQARNRHLDYYLHISQMADQEISSTNGLDWLNQMDLEVENIRSAIEWGLNERPEDALSLIGNFFLFFTLRFNLREAQRLAREAMARMDQLSSDERKTDKRYRHTLARGYLALGFFCMNMGEMVPARAALEQALRLVRELSDMPTLNMVLGIFSVVSNFLNETENAIRYAQESLDYSNKFDLRWAIALNLVSLAWAEGRQGHFEKRKVLLNRYSEMALGLDSPMFIDARLMVGLEARAYGDLTGARIIFEQSLEHLSVIRSRTYEAIIRSELAHIQRQSGHTDAAREAYHQTLQLWIDLGHRGAIAHQFECFAFIAIEDHQFERAAILFGAAQALRESIDGPMTVYEQREYDQAVALVREGLPEPALSQAWSAGREMTMDKVVSFAMETAVIDQ